MDERRETEWGCVSEGTQDTDGVGHDPRGRPGEGSRPQGWSRGVEVPARFAFTG